MDVQVASLVCKQLRLKGSVGERSGGRIVIFDLFPCTISLSLYIHTKPPQTHLQQLQPPLRQHHPPPSSSSTCAAGPLVALATAAPENPAPVPCRFVSCGLLLLPVGGLKTAERQPDEGTECEGRRGRSSDLSEWRRPSREI